MSDNSTLSRATSPWLIFTVGSFIVAASMMAGGIFFMDASFAAKGFYAMAALMLVHTSITITKTLCDSEESERLDNRLERAKMEKILREAGAGDVS